MTTDERLEKVERELARAKRRSRRLLAVVGLVVGAVALAWIIADAGRNAQADIFSDALKEGRPSVTPFSDALQEPETALEGGKARSLLEERARIQQKPKARPRKEPTAQQSEERVEIAFRLRDHYLASGKSFEEATRLAEQNLSVTLKGITEDQERKMRTRGLIRNYDTTRHYNITLDGLSSVEILMVVFTHRKLAEEFMDFGREIERLQAENERLVRENAVLKTWPQYATTRASKKQPEANREIVLKLHPQDALRQETTRPLLGFSDRAFLRELSSDPFAEQREKREEIERRKLRRAVEGVGDALRERAWQDSFRDDLRHEHWLNTHPYYTGP